MIDDALDDPLKEVQAALSVEPSPAFTARVRARVAAEEGRTSWFAGWRLVPAACATLLVAITGGIFVWHAIDQKRADLRVGPTPVIARVPPRASVATTGRRTVVSREPEVLVPPDQAIALNNWLRAMRQGVGGSSEALRAVPVVIAQLPELPPIVIDPIKIEFLTVVPPAGGKEKEK